MASGAKFILSMTCGIRRTSAVHGTRNCGDALFKTAPFALAFGPGVYFFFSVCKGLSVRFVLKEKENKQLLL
jgi:hypothetical protein